MMFWFKTSNIQGCCIDEYVLPKFNHLLIVFGGVAGIEAALEVKVQLQTDLMI